MTSFPNTRHLKGFEHEQVSEAPPPKNPFGKPLADPLFFSWFLGSRFLVVENSYCWRPNTSRKQVPLFDFNVFLWKVKEPLAISTEGNATQPGAQRKHTYRRCEVSPIQKTTTTCLSECLGGIRPMFDWRFPPMFDWMFRGICQQTYLNYVLSIFRLAFVFGVGKSWKPIHPSENMGLLKVAVFKKTKTLANHPPCCTEKFRCFRCLEVSIYEETLAKYQVDK